MAIIKDKYKQAVNIGSTSYQLGLEGNEISYDDPQYNFSQDEWTDYRAGYVEFLKLKSYQNGYTGVAYTGETDAEQEAYNQGKADKAKGTFFDKASNWYQNNEQNIANVMTLSTDLFNWYKSFTKEPDPNQIKTEATIATQRSDSDVKTWYIVGGVAALVVVLLVVVFMKNRGKN